MALKKPKFVKVKGVKPQGGEGISDNLNLKLKVVACDTVNESEGSRLAEVPSEVLRSRASRRSTPSATLRR